MRRHILFLITLAPVLSFAQSVPNPDCAHAIPLEISSTNIPVEWFVQNWPAIDLGPMDPPSACTSGDQQVGWFSFTANATKHWMRTAPEGVSCRVELFSGSCGSLTSLLCTGPETVVEFTDLSIGTTYYFRTWNFDTGSEFSVALFSMAANNDCATAQELFPKSGGAPVLPGTPASTFLATQTAPSVPPAANDDIWYRFTATAEKHFVRSSWTTNEDVTTNYYSGTCGNLTPTYATGLTIGQTYYVQQYTESNNADDFVDGWTDVFTPAPNDECAGAIPVQVTLANEAPVPFTFSDLASSSSTVPCYTENTDVWFTFQAPAEVIRGTGFSAARWALYSGSCGSLTCVANQIGSEVVLTGLLTGQTYYLKIGSPVAERNVSMILSAVPPNDDCTDAMSLDVQSGSEPSEWANSSTHGATQSMPGCNNVNESDDDVWFSFTAQDTAQFLHLRAMHDNAVLRVELFEGDCASPQSLFCSDPFNAFSDKVRLSGLTPGNAYLFRVYTTIGGYAFLRLALTNTLQNDACAGALELTSATLEAFNTLPLVDGLSATDGTGSCATTRDIWYRFTATGGSATFLAPNEAVTNVELLTGTCGALTSVACRSNVTRAGFSGLVSGQQYFLRYSAPDAIRTRPMLFLTPPNDEVANATLLQPSGSTFASQVKEAWTFGATQSLSRLCGTQAVPDDDVWFKFVATQDAHTITVQDRNLQFPLTALAQGLRIEAYAPLTLDSAGLAADVLGCANGTLALSGLTIGNTIYFRVYSFQGTANDVTAFLVSISSGNNDEASGAMPIGYATDYTMLYDTDGATQSQPPAHCSVEDFSDDDIWFKFVANGGPGRVISSHADADLTLELFNGTPGSLISMTCSDNILVLPENLASGQTYYVRLYSWRNNIDVSGRLGLFASPSITANSCVDEDCLGPVLLENPGIEQGGVCAPVRQLIPGGDGITNTPIAPGWYDYDYTTADSYSSCSDFNDYLEVPQLNSTNEFYSICSRNGKGMAGFFAQEIPGYREYHSAPLTTPLVPGEPYLVSFYLNMHPFSANRAINGFGALLTTGIPLDKRHVEPQLQDLRIIEGGEWRNICGVVVADQAYDHITIGMFLEDNELLYDGNAQQSSYYFLDDVVVAHIDDANCITGIGDVPAIDHSENNGSGDNLRVYPNPANDRVNILCDARAFGKTGVIEVYDVTGKLVHAEQVASLMALQPLELSSIQQEGLYLIMVRVEGQAPRSARVVVRH